MVFNANLVAVIKSNGKVLRETGKDTNNFVHMPFGNEYSILLKNLNTVKALVDVEIDGRTAINGLIIQPNSSVELERFFEDNMNKGHRFKFIEKNEDIKNFRSDKVEDGIIRISYKFEKTINKTLNEIYGESFRLGPDKWWEDRIDKFNTRWRERIGTGNFIGDNTYYSSFMGSTVAGNPTVTRSLNVNKVVNEDGITVEGSESNQSFVHGNFGVPEDEEHVINIQLKGHFPNEGEVKEPLTVDKKIQCKYCGRRYKSSCKYCSNCGAHLI